MKKPRFIPDAELKTLMREPLAELHKDVVPLPVDEGAHDEPARKQRNKKKAKSANDETSWNERPAQLPEEQRTLLMSIHDYPWLCATARSQRLGLSSDQFTKTNRSCQEADLIEDYPMNLGFAIGGNVKLLALTQAGYRAINNMPKLEKAENCSYEHWAAQWVWCLYKRSSKGILEAVIEKQLGAVRADVGWYDGEMWHAGEVVIHSLGNVVQTVRDDLASGFATVTVACRNNPATKSVESQLQANLSQQELERVTVTQLSQLWFVPRFVRVIRGEEDGPRS